MEVSSKQNSSSRSTSARKKNSNSKKRMDSSTVKPKTRTDRNLEEIEELNRRCQDEAPGSGKLYRSDGKVPKLFSDLPLSQYSMSGLERGKFIHMTRIQRLAIPHALVGRDILGAARTGSGKTLAFLIPMMEKLYRSSWCAGLGIGGVVISPTRELALQIYEVLRVVAFRHIFGPCGLMIGGSDFRKEQAHVNHISLLVCTPGRFLQHLEQTVMDTMQVQVLVLDEADRLLDLGFKQQLSQILEYMPGDRQTMLFSATQTKSVKALAKLSLKRPEYVSVLEAGDDDETEKSNRAPTPSNLAQVYSVCQLPDKLDVLYSFIRSHLKSKVIVFLASCKQAKYVGEAFRKLRPGVPLMSLHGKIKQQRRMHIYYDFIKKPAAVLFATDIAARGLDFPNVDWVVQVDCPEDVPSYIHRVGRTARYKKRGRSLLLLLPNEAEAFVSMLTEAHIPITEKRVNPNRKHSIQRKLVAQVAQDRELQLHAQKAFKSYLRSVFLQPLKDVFDVKKLPMGAFAQSLGLGFTPRMKFSGPSGEQGRAELRKQKNVPYALAKLKNLEDDDGDEDVLALLEKLGSKSRSKLADEAEEDQKKSKFEKLLSLKASNTVSQSRLNREGDSEDSNSEDGDDLLVFRGSQPPIEEGDDEDVVSKEDLSKRPSKKQKKRLKIDAAGASRGRVRPTRVVFDDEGNEISGFEKLAQEFDSDEVKQERKDYLAKLSEKMEKKDKQDRKRDRERVKTKRLKERERKKMKNNQEEKPLYQLASSDDGNGESDNEGHVKSTLEAEALKLIEMGT